MTDDLGSGMRCFRCRQIGHWADECQFVAAVRRLIAKPTRASAYVIGRPKDRAGPHVVGKAKPAQFVLGGAGASAALPPLGDKGVYVLELKDGGFYVGKSGAIEERLRQHAGKKEPGAGAVCAKGFVGRVPPLTPRSEDLEAWERAETLARMYKHGIGRVRGWMYTSQEMSEAQREHAFAQICEKHDLCRRCGHGGHFAAECFAGVRAPWARRGEK
jgi:hypothetical protein